MALLPVRKQKKREQRSGTSVPRNRWVSGEDTAKYSNKKDYSRTSTRMKKVENGDTNKEEGGRGTQYNKINKNANVLRS